MPPRLQIAQAPPPVQALWRPHADRRSSCVPQVGHGQRPVCSPWGKSLRGIAAPRFRHGRYSTLVPLNLAERYYCVHPEDRPRPRVRHGGTVV
jgi:hypothetical protein